MSVGGFEDTVFSDPIHWTIGPFHPILPSPFKLSAQLDGEIVSSAVVHSGFSNRGVLEVLRRQTWGKAIAVLGRVDPSSSVFSEWAYCLAVEKALGLELHPRTLGIRVVMAEVTRISAHLYQLSRIAQQAGSEVAFHFMLREREQFLDLMELVSGSRQSPTFLRIGGVRDDVSEGFLERLQEVCHRLLERVTEYNDLLTYNEAFVRRISGKGVISSQLVRRHGITGIPLKAIHTNQDLRWLGQAPGYELVQHQESSRVPPVGVEGDLHHRFVFCLQEMTQSARLLQELAQHLPAGPYRIEGAFDRVPPGNFSAVVEAPRGRLRVEVTSDGGDRPISLSWQSPSVALLQALPEYLRGASIEDLGLWLMSLDLQIGEVEL
ncbi:MAG: hypothetical protein RJB38_1962 [Pseudomonadota bacterium]|jgi:NADH-quinone oxidoreductase subunit D